MSSDMSEKSPALVGIGEWAVGGRAVAIGIAAAAAPPRDTKFVATVISWWGMEAQEVSHLRAQLQCVKLGVTGRVWYMSPHGATLGGACPRCPGRDREA